MIVYLSGHSGGHGTPGCDGQEGAAVSPGPAGLHGIQGRSHTPDHPFQTERPGPPAFQHSHAPSGSSSRHGAAAFMESAADGIRTGEEPSARGAWSDLGHCSPTEPAGQTVVPCKLQSKK